MKKTGILIIVAISLALQAQPISTRVNLADKITVDDQTGSTTTQSRVVERVDDQTGTITTTTTITQSVRQVEFDRAELQTELDHLPERIATLQDQIDKLNERSAEIDEILAVFK